MKATAVARIIPGLQATADAPFLAALLEHIPSAVLAMDLQGRVLYRNKHAEQIFGKSARTAGGPDSGEIEMPPAQEAVFKELADKALRAGHAGGELRLPSRTGSLRSLRLAFRLLRDERGAPQALAVIAEDVTERERAEEQHVHLQRLSAIGKVTCGLAHDLNNLLMVILGRGELLASGSAQSEVQRRHLEEFRKAAGRAAALTKQLLSFGRPRAAASKGVDANLVVQELASLLRSVLREDIKLALSFQADLGKVWADPVQLEQIVLNLALNARDAMPRGGRLLIQTAEARLKPGEMNSGDLSLVPGPYVVLTVSDTGCGMTPDAKRHLFEPFFTTKQDGTGLGLSMVQHLVRQMGGDIRLETAVGQGTAFRIFLPRAQE